MTATKRRAAAQKLAKVTRQRDTLLKELERLARLCTAEGDAFYAEIHQGHVMRAERVAKRIRAAIELEKNNIDD